MPTSRMDEAVAAEVHNEAEEHRATPGLTVTEYVVIAAASGWDDQGQEVTQVVVIPSGSEHRIAGLLRHATVRMDAEIVSGYTDEP